MKTSATEPNLFRRIVKDLKSDLRGTINFCTMLSSPELSRPLIDTFCGRFTVPHQLSPRKFPLAVYPIQKDIVSLLPHYSFALGDYEAL